MGSYLWFCIGQELFCLSGAVCPPGLMHLLGCIGLALVRLWFGLGE